MTDRDSSVGVVAAIKGCPTGWIIDRKFTAEHWAEGTMHAYGDNAGALAMPGMLPDRWVLVVHGRNTDRAGAATTTTPSRTSTTSA